jgi:hypothetical protein
MKLEPTIRAAWVNALESESATWILFGADASIPLFSDRMAGMAGLIDWRLHGQLSGRVADLAADSFSLFPLHKGAQNFLLFHYGAAPNAKAVAEQLDKLGVKEVAAAETTFPKDFLPKLKQTLEKGGVRYRRLEPEV